MKFESVDLAMQQVVAGLGFEGRALELNELIERLEKTLFIVKKKLKLLFLEGKERKYKGLLIEVVFVEGRGVVFEIVLHGDPKGPLSAIEVKALIWRQAETSQICQVLRGLLDEMVDVKWE